MPDLTYRSVLEMLAVPAIVIAAASIILSSIYPRLTSAIARIRYFDAKAQEIHEKRTDSRSEDLNRRLNSIRLQSKWIAERVTQLKNSILMFELTIFFAVIAAIMLAFTLVHPVFLPLTLAFLLIALIFLMIGIIVSLVESSVALKPVEVEHYRMMEVPAGPNTRLFA